MDSSIWPRVKGCRSQGPKAEQWPFLPQMWDKREISFQQPARGNIQKSLLTFQGADLEWNLAPTRGCWPIATNPLYLCMFNTRQFITEDDSLNPDLWAWLCWGTKSQPISRDRISSEAKTHV